MANNALKDIIGEIKITHEKEPINTFSITLWTYETEDGNNQVYFIKHNSSVPMVFNSMDIYIDDISSDTNIYVYKKKYYNTLTKMFINVKNIFTITNKQIISASQISNFIPESLSYKFPEKKIPIINMGQTSNHHFAFNIIDKHESILAFILAMNRRREDNNSCMPTELINDILPQFIDFLNINKDNKSKTIFKCEYDFQFPKFISIYQIKKLLSLDMIKLIVKVNPYNNDYMVLSNEAFDSDNNVRKKFGSKIEMHKYIQLWTNRLTTYKYE